MKLLTRRELMTVYHRFLYSLALTRTTILHLQGCVAEVALQPLAKVPQHAISGKLGLLLRGREEEQHLWHVAWCSGEGKDAVEVVRALPSLSEI